MGCILSELIFGKKVFANDYSVTNYEKTKQLPTLPRELRLVYRERPFPLELRSFEQLHKLIYSMLNLSPQERPSAKTLFERFTRAYDQPATKSSLDPWSDTVLVNSDELKPWSDGFLVNSTNTYVAVVSKPCDWDELERFGHPERFREIYRKHPFRCHTVLWDVGAKTRIWTGSQKMPGKERSAIWPVLPSFSSNGGYLAAFDGMNIVHVLDITARRRYKKMIEDNQNVVAVALHDRHTLAIISLVHSEEDVDPVLLPTPNRYDDLIVIPMQRNLSFQTRPYKVQAMFTGDGSILFVALLLDHLLTVISYNTQALTTTEIYRRETHISRKFLNNFQLRGMLKKSETWCLVLWTCLPSNNSRTQKCDEISVLYPTGQNPDVLANKNKTVAVKDQKLWIGRWGNMAADKMWLWVWTPSTDEWKESYIVRGMSERNIFMGLAITDECIAYLNQKDLDLQIVNNSGEIRSLK